MAQFYDFLNEETIDFITNQSEFYAATAPWAGDHINISPRGHPSRTFAVLNSKTVAYLDTTGSGCETIAHIYENGRLTLMFASSGSAPQIVRLFGKGRVVEKWDSYYQQLRSKMATENGGDIDATGARAVIVLKVQKVQVSSGESVPSGEDGDDEQAGSKDANAVDDWARKTLNDHRSLDGLPGMMTSRRAYDENIAAEDTKAWFRKVSRQQDAIALGFGFGILFMIILGLVGVLNIKVVFIQHILNYQRRQMGLPEDYSWKSEL